MTRFVIDPAVLLLIAAGSVEVRTEHQLVAPSALRSQAVAKLYEAVRAGELERSVALERMERVTEIKVRLLNDRVSRSVAWKIAEQLDLAGIVEAEYLAVAQLQADALVALDDRIVRVADSVVPTAPVNALGQPA
jgi:predicted nucleic acid-binding protein